MRRGTLVLDRTFPSIGRIQIASGTKDKSTFEALNSMLSMLWSLGRADLLSDIRSRKVHPMVVFSEFRQGNVQTLPRGSAMAPLGSLWGPWVDSYDCSEYHRRNLRAAFRSLQAHCREALTVNEVPAAMRAYRQKMKASPVMFNRTRAAMLSFLRDNRHSQEWSEVRDIRAYRVKRRATHSVSPQELSDITTQLEPCYGDMLWSMALTGMGPSEYWGKWEVTDNSVIIHGTKREGRERIVPLVVAPVVPTRIPKSVMSALKSVKPKMVLYDMRRSYARWLEEAGVPRTRRKIYMGHGTRDVTDLYERHEIQSYLTEDAGRLTGFTLHTSSSGGRKLLKVV
jgi:hypothetical protein